MRCHTTRWSRAEADLGTARMAFRINFSELLAIGSDLVLSLTTQNKRRMKLGNKKGA